MIKKALFNIKGMTRDLAVSKFSPEYAFENKNLRLEASDDNTTGALVNEKGNLKVDLPILGVPVGQAVIDNALILFSAEYDESTGEHINDHIYKYEFNDAGNLIQESLYDGDLAFSAKKPIECISVYESDKLKKVYWTDGINQPRVINTSATAAQRQHWTPDTFNFVRRPSLKEVIVINRNLVSTGYFAPGVLQYCFTYFNLYGQETNIFYTSPLYYASYNNRGASPEDTVSNSFTITIKADTFDTSFDFIRVYAILRTSLDGTPQVRKVVDLSLSQTSGEDIIYTDNGSEGSTVDPTQLLFVGGEEITAGTFGQKNNTLFLGDIEVKRKFVSQTIKDNARNLSISFSNKLASREGAPSGLYPYINQLTNNSISIKTLKYLEYYRFGIQLQHYTGRWSEPIFITDAQNNRHPEIDTQGYIRLPYALTSLTSEFLTALRKGGYVRVRPVIVFPNLTEREVICQGVLCPTVYNVGDRGGNAPFAQSSWFFRPSSYLDVDNEKETYDLPSGTTREDSWAGQVRNDWFGMDSSTQDLGSDNFNKGKWVEFRHNYPIPSNNKENAEIQCIMDPPERPYIESAGTPAGDSWIAKNMENFYVDQSIVTLHSPDIEFDTKVRSLDTSGLKLRIIGAINLTASASDISIQSETPVNNYVKDTNGSDPEYFKEMPPGFYKETIGTQNLSKFGWRSIVSGAFWMDEVSAFKSGWTVNNPGSMAGFVIYPWHRSVSYNNLTSADPTGYISAKVGKKKLSILRFSYRNTYLANVWNADDSDEGRTGISDAVIFDSNEVSMIRIKAPKNSGLDDINYYGNIDKLITFPSSADTDKNKGYPIITTIKGIIKSDDEEIASPLHFIMAFNYHKPDEPWLPGLLGLRAYTDQTHALDPVSMKYKSTPHAVMALNYTADNKQTILPTNYYLKNGQYWEANGIVRNPSYWPFWDKKKVFSGINQKHIPYEDFLPEYGYLWLAELYNDTVSNRFGGTSEEALENNSWLPAGLSVSLYYSDGTPKTDLQVKWEEGDTYYQRYDCLKTYPFTMEDQNSVVDILSFMCETRVNIDGRYDRNRGQTSNLVMTPTNFNLLNPVYSQQNNFFTYRAINSKKNNEVKFPNSITWTKTKTLGEEVDTWTNITLASTLDLDGDSGKVKAIRRFNDVLLAFQDKGISQILYDENVQIAASTGVPIEIANSGKVQGRRYISNHIGCSNKWSICSTPNGIYFLDTLGRDLYLFNGQFNNLSDKLGFHSWVNENISTLNPWTPDGFDGCVIYYDKPSGEVMLITKDTCLAFSESLAQFTSFYDYGEMAYFANLKDRGIALHRSSDNQIYYPFLHREGEYNKFFEEYKPFWTTVIVNPNPTSDKIFNNLEYRADGFSENNYLSNYSFDTLRTWNEYQEGISNLSFLYDAPSSLKKKFRIWRANIPRWNVDKNGQIANKRDRMRNPWLYLKLSMEDINHLNTNTKTVLHDLTVDYFE